MDLTLENSVVHDVLKVLIVDLIVSNTVNGISIIENFFPVTDLVCIKRFHENLALILIDDAVVVSVNLEPHLVSSLS